jgi:hypothetical protein
VVRLERDVDEPLLQRYVDGLDAFELPDGRADGAGARRSIQAGDGDLDVARN